MKRVKILFIYPDISNYALYKGIFYTGIASLSAFLKENIPCSISLLHLTREIKRQELLNEIEERDPDLVAFSSTTNMYPYVKKWSKWIKDGYKKINIVCGGVHPTISPEEVIQNPYIDVACIGEGEDSIVELCDKLINGKDINRIEGLWVKDISGKIYKNRIRPAIQDLDSLPFPDRDIFDYKNLHFESERCATIMLSRGCPYSCAYCCNDILRKIYAKGGCRYVRFRSVPSAIRELRLILRNYPSIKRFAFDDDILPLDKVWFREFARQYKKEIALPYECNLHPNLVNEEIVVLLKESGCNQVDMGIESGSDFIRNQILNRNITKEQLVNAFVLCKRNGLRIYSYNMVGLPFENLGMILETVKMNAALPTDANQVTIFYPYSKTPLYNICKKEHLIEEGKGVRDYSRDTILKFNAIKRNQVIFIQRYFRIIVKFYKIQNKLPGSISYFMQIFFEKVFLSSILSISVLPVLSKIIDIFWENKTLANLARNINRKSLNRTL
jgi:radical SAM superfamily enzyme YgiQ (UPF0313 family)